MYCALLSPQRIVHGAECGVTGSATPLANSQKEDSVTEDRIASILSEAQQAMHAKKAADQVTLVLCPYFILFILNFFHSVFKHVDLYLYTRHTHKYEVNMYGLNNGVKEAYT